MIDGFDQDEIFATDEYVRDFEIAFTQARTAIERSQEKHKKAADKHKRQMDLKQGDWILLKFEKARLLKLPSGWSCLCIGRYIMHSI